MIFSGEDTGFIDFNVLPKVKYLLYIQSYKVYEFTTTRIPEKECIELLKERLPQYRGIYGKSYFIYKMIGGEKTLLDNGINPKI